MHGDAFKEALQWVWWYNVGVAKMSKSYCLFDTDSDFISKDKTKSVQASLSSFPDVPFYRATIFLNSLFKFL